ncbi:alcohol oxidase [Auricularia subglabra TFB-10046 SS5]|nr:alcohol oxidase [Auricularia subglabra TFB-10046 SS5]
MHARYTASILALFQVSRAASSASSYDFIVVGGGTAGLSLSTRLSKLLPSSSILVVEAGPSAPSEPGINIPGKRRSTFGTKYDWNFTSIPQAHAASRTIPLVRGKVLGGSSAMNLMTWDRASRIEYDSWSDLPFAGPDSGWDWNGMYDGMLRVENFSRPAEPGVYGRRGVGYGGPIHTVVNEDLPSQQLAFIPTMKRLGLSLNLESLDGDPLGVMRQPSNLRSTDYTRSYSIAYLPLAGPNLRVRTDTIVAKIIFAGHGRLTATGVTLVDGSMLLARKEVILSAGTFLSPVLLERSGIGNSSLLRDAGIAPVLDLPGVGEHLQDHVRIQNSYQLKPNFSSVDELVYNSTYAAEQLALYNAGVRGTPYDYTGSGYAYFTFSQANITRLSHIASESAAKNSPIDEKKLDFLSDARVPDLEIIFSDGYAGAKGYPSRNSSLFGQGFFTLIGGVMHTLAQGSVHINVSAPHGKPIIDPRYLSTPYDIAAISAAAKYLRRVAETPPLRDVWVAEYEPGAAVQTDEDWAAYARSAMFSIDHPTGTCSMMAREKGGVVDAQLRVHGTKNLRVVDASIMPVQIAAHIQTATYGIAERAALLIAKAWNA